MTPAPTVFTIHPREHLSPFQTRPMTDPHPNEPCPCGSGAKYKYCCLREKKRGAANDDLSDEGGWRRELARAVNAGFEARQQGDAQAAADTWLDGWKKVRAQIPAGVATLSGLERETDGQRSLVSWVFTTVNLLRHLGADHPDYADAGAEFLADILGQFPGESDDNQRNLRADRAWLLAAADRWDEADEEFDHLLEDFPTHAAGYAARADALLTHRPDAADEAVEILEAALEQPVDDADAWDLQSRLDEARRLQNHH